jgi:hypothetical protein
VHFRPLEHRLASLLKVDDDGLIAGKWGLIFWSIPRSEDE